MNTSASNPAKYSHTEIALHVRAMAAEALRVPVWQVPETANLRGLGLGDLAVLDVVSELERTLAVDLLEVRTLAFRPDATVGQVIDLIEGAVSGGTH